MEQLESVLNLGLAAETWPSCLTLQIPKSKTLFLNKPFRVRNLCIYDQTQLIVGERA